MVENCFHTNNYLKLMFVRCRSFPYYGNTTFYVASVNKRGGCVSFLIFLRGALFLLLLFFGLLKNIFLLLMCDHLWFIENSLYIVFCLM